MWVKPKCIWESVLFQIFFTIFQKKNTYSHTGFDFPDNRSNMHHYSATTISFWLFSNWTPWTFSKLITGPSNSEFLKYSFFKHFLFFWVFYIFTSFQINSWQLLADDSQFTNFEESLQRLVWFKNKVFINALFCWS